MISTFFDDVNLLPYFSGINLQQRPTSITVNAHIIAQEIGEEWRNTTIFVWYATLLSTLQIIPLVYFAVTNSSMSVVSSIATMESKHPSLFLPLTRTF